jgi:hypothetical protein
VAYQAAASSACLWHLNDIGGGGGSYRREESQSMNSGGEKIRSSSQQSMAKAAAWRKWRKISPAASA